MTDKEIIKALECCISCKNCDICPQHSTDCVSDLLKLVDDLITCQQEDIEKLKKLLTEEEEKYKLCAKRFYKLGVKEFAEKLKARIIEDFLKYNTDTTIGYIDNLIKEMVGDTE